MAADDPRTKRRPLRDWIAWAAIAIAMAGLRARLLDVPLERDEGEYANAAQLLLQGAAPYAHAYTMKLPGTIAAYAAILALAGESPAAIHAGLLVANALTLVCVALLARRFVGSVGASTAAAAFGLLALSRGLLGFTANAEHFALLPALAALLGLLRVLERRGTWPLAGAGALFGVAVLMKQHAAFFLAFGALWVWIDGRPDPRARVAARLAILLAGAAIPLAATGLAIAAAGAWDPFWFWTVQYAGSYLDQVAAADALALLALRAGRNAWIFSTVWLLAAAGLAMLPFDSDRRRRRFLGLFALLSFVAVCPGLSFREHYFLLIVPAAALLAGAAADAAMRALSLRSVTPIAVAIAFAAALVQERDYLFRWTTGEIVREAYGQQGFEESIAIARYVRERTAADDRIGVLGSEPQIYFYARRRAVTPLLYMYPLLEDQPLAARMQLELIEQFERALPRYVVATSNPRSWLPHGGVTRTVLDWIPAFLAEHYERVAFADLAPDGTPVYAFGDDAKSREPANPTGLQVYRRK